MSIDQISPEWFQSIFADDADKLRIDGKIVRQEELLSETQDQTKDTFGYKWNRRESFDGEEFLTFTTNWMKEKYGDVEKHIERLGKKNPRVLDAGCGAGMNGFCYFGPVMDQIRFVASDISSAVDMAATRAEEQKFDVGLLQADLTSLPIKDESFDLIFSEGVLHHTDSTRGAISALSRKLAKDGLFMFYVYKKKGPVREFTDDYIRDQLKDMAPEEAWKILEPLTKLGIALGELDAKITLDEPIDLLGIPAGEMSVQRLFYWNIAKLFYRPEMTFDNMNHTNFDWYTPMNAHRQTPEEVTQWCEENGLEILTQNVEPAGITTIAQKK